MQRLEEKSSASVGIRTPVVISNVWDRISGHRKELRENVDKTNKSVKIPKGIFLRGK
jgi:hypothetical protein